VPVQLEIKNDRRFPHEVQVSLYRVAQESLNNVAKHADAAQVWLTLDCGDREATLTIRDDGRGFAEVESNNAGLGMEIMRDRVRDIGGNLEIKSNFDSGTTVTVHWTETPSDNRKHEY
jgi:signal transduction histidine kinase